MPTQEIWEGTEFVELLDDFKRQSKRLAVGAYGTAVQFRLKAFYHEKSVWEYQNSTGQVNPAGDKAMRQVVSEAADMCGASKLMTSFSGHGEEKLIKDPDWKPWFLERMSGKDSIPDTNFIYRHYCSNVLSSLLGENFDDLHFLLPRLTVLEIERRGNQSPEGSKDRRLAFYAAREVNFLRREISLFGMFPNMTVSMMTGFTEKAGRQLVDMWIRKEIHDAIQSRWLSSENLMFLTCDLMNALAAEAEGLQTCYFIRLPQESISIDRDNSEQLFGLILATVMMLDEIKLDIILSGDIVDSSFILKGMWEGKTTSQWYADCIQKTNC